MNPAFPMCSSEQIVQRAALSLERLIRGYRESNLRIDVRHLLPAGDGELRLLNCQACDAQWFQPLATGDEAFYAELQRNDWYYQTDKPEHAHAASLIPTGSRVLEAGCGSGAFAACLDPAVSYRGLEFNGGALARARAAGLDATMRSNRPLLDDASFSDRLARRAARTPLLKRPLAWLGERTFPHAGRGHSVTIWADKPIGVKPHEAL